MLQVSLARSCTVFEVIHDSFLPVRSCIEKKIFFFFFYHDFMKNNYGDLFHSEVAVCGVICL